MSDVVVTGREGSVFLVAIDRPEAKNAFDRALVERFVARLAGIAAAAPRAVVITGAGDAFSAGFDVNGIDPDQGAGEPLPDARFEPVVRAVEALPCPSVAAVNGDAFGGGLDLALACDLRLAAPGARLAMTPCRLGLVYSPSGIARLLWKLGPTAARRLLFTAQPIGAAEAAALGAVEVVDPPGELLPAALALAARIAQNAPLAVAGTRRTILALEEAAVRSLSDEARALIDAARSGAFRSADLREGRAAFLAKRPPLFSGK